LIINEISKFKEITIEALIRNMNIYKIELTKKNKKIIFKCSYKILPESLEKISSIFENEKKSTFPHEFSSERNLNYIGEVPNVKYFKNEKEYLMFKNNNKIFDFKQKSIEYCTRDVIITKNFMKKIREMSKNYGINIDKIYSAPSLSFKIFENKFNSKKLSFNIKEI
jgi:S-adenosylmethionine:tRNA-ribosyltransferase-isomerase (queuine synthetase)